ncbi:uncharacterized protein TNCV_4430201 [Trichonephila clavipes]|nr:uncharacterized protein TNCV_4430201 [Trichonephila clavipes]
MPKSNALKGKKSFVKEKKRKLAASPVEKVTKKPQKNNANSSSATAKSRSPSGGSPSLAQINTDFVNHPVPSTTEPSTSLVRVGTDVCESIIDSILRYKDYDFHKNA